MGQFLTGLINKAVSSCRNTLTKNVKCNERRSDHLSILKKCSHLLCLSCLEQLRQFLITTQLLSCHD